MFQRHSLENAETLFSKLPREALIKVFVSFGIKMIEITHLPLDTDHFFPQFSCILRNLLRCLYTLARWHDVTNVLRLCAPDFSVHNFSSSVNSPGL